MVNKSLGAAKQAKNTFVYREEMDGLNWGKFYNDHKDDNLDKDKLEAEVAELMADDEVQKKRGVYEYALYGDEKVLNLRQFDKSVVKAKYERQKGTCHV